MNFAGHHILSASTPSAAPVDIGYIWSDLSGNLKICTSLTPVTWVVINGSALPDPVTPAHGGTGATTLTAHGVLIGEGTGTVAATAAGAANTLLHGNGAADPTFSAVVEGDISLSDVTTDNVSTAAHGFAPKAPNDATKFLDGTGAYSVPPGLAPDAYQIQFLAHRDVIPPLVQLASAGVRGILPQSKGGLGIDGTTLTGAALLVENLNGIVVSSISLGTSNTVLHGNTGTYPSWSGVDLTADVINILPSQNTDIDYVKLQVFG